MRITHEFNGPDTEGARNRGAAAIAALLIVAVIQGANDINEAFGRDTVPEPPPPAVTPSSTPPSP